MRIIWIDVMSRVGVIRIRRMRFTTQWWAAFKVKSFKAVVVRRKWGGGGGGGGGNGRRLEITSGGATSQVGVMYFILLLFWPFNIQGREAYLSDFVEKKKKATKTKPLYHCLCSNIYGPIFSSLV